MNSDSDLRLCMIGAGRHASRNIYPCFSFLKKAAVVANADLDGERARQRAKAFGIPTSYTDYREMLREEKPDGVLVCVGPDFHARCAIELMELGFHVYTEKPPAPNLALCQQVLETQQRTGRICMTGFKKRFAPAYVKARALLGDETYGEPSLLSILRTSSPYRTADHYLLDSAIHVVDLATFLFGTVRTVHANKGPSATFSVTFDFTGSAVGTLALTDRLPAERGWEQVTLITTEGLCVQVDNSVEMLAFHNDKPVAAHKPNFVAGGSHSSVEMGFVNELQAFVDAINSGTIPDSSIVHGTHTMAIIEAINRAVQTGQPANVESV